MNERGTTMDLSAFFTLNYGVYIISSKDAEGNYVGCIANTFQQITAEPLQVSVVLNKDNCTTRSILDTKKFTASVLTEAATMEQIGTFGFRSSNEINKFEAMPFKTNNADIPAVIHNVAAIFYVNVTNTVDVGSHIIFIGEAEDAEVVSNDTPMTYGYYHNVLRGKTPPKASSYQGDAQANATAANNADNSSAASKAEPEEGSKKRIGWRCTLCGYVVEADELPPDYACPICGVTRDMFERIELD